MILCTGCSGPCAPSTCSTRGGWVLSSPHPSAPCSQTLHPTHNLSLRGVPGLGLNALPLLVLVKVRALAESAAALGACVGPLAGVRVLVLQQAQAALKGLLAQRARVLYGTGVCTLVLAQLERWLKALLHSGHAYGFSPATGTP